LRGKEVSQTKKQHAIAIDILAKLGLDNIKLEHQRDGLYSYHAWSTPPIPAHNGSPPTVRRGKIRVRGVT
jgi:hypothetical protein